MTTHTTTLITGASKGLGAETARRLAALGHTVWLGVRDTTDGERVAAAIRRETPDADLRVVALDVTSDESVTAAFDVVVASGTGLDVLVNNAGVIGPLTGTLETRPTDFLAAFGVNLLGPVRVTTTFLPLLTASDQPRLVMVSSGLGSIEHVRNPERIEHGVPGIVYQSSKAALDMVAAQYEKALPGVRVCSVDPGYTATDLNGHSGHQTVTEGTDAIVAAATADVVPGLRFDREDLAA